MYREGSSRFVEILLVEDNAADVRLLQEGLKEVQVSYRLKVVQDGEQAVQYLRREAPFEDAVQPDLVLLDLNLPVKTGLDVLSEVKSEPLLRRIPIVVLTSSRSEDDVNRAYEYGANSYLRKPYSLDEIYDLARSLEHYWLHLALLPSRAA